MAVIARALSEESIDSLAKMINQLTPFPTQRTLEGDSEKGRLVYSERCMECHRFNGQGDLVFGSSPLTTFQDWYLASTLNDFRSGLRGQDLQDELGNKMRAVVEDLDAESCRDVVVYIAQLAAEHPPGE